MNPASLLLEVSHPSEASCSLADGLLERLATRRAGQALCPPRIPLCPTEWYCTDCCPMMSMGGALVRTSQRLVAAMTESCSTNSRGGVLVPGIGVGVEATMQKGLGSELAAGDAARSMHPEVSEEVEAVLMV